MPRKVGLCLFVVALMVAVACGSDADKAGGRTPTAVTARPVGKPVTLTLAAVDDLWARQYAAAARRLLLNARCGAIVVMAPI